MAECVSKWIYTPTLTLIQPVSLSLPLSPFFLLYCFHPASFSLMAHTCQEKGCGTVGTTCAQAMPVHPGSDHNVLLTVHNPDSVPTHLSKPHHHQQPGLCVTGGKKTICDVCFCSLQTQILLKCFYPRKRTTKNSYNCQFENISLTPVGL